MTTTRKRPEAGEYDLEFEGADLDDFWSFTQLRDWIMLLGVSHAAFRLYCLLRSLLTDGKRRRTNRTRRLTHDQLCWLSSTANGGKAVSVSALKGWLRELETAGLIRPDGERLVTSTGRGGIQTHARGFRIASLPPKGFEGWRNAWDKLDAYREDWRKNPAAPTLDGQNSDGRTDQDERGEGDDTAGQIDGQNSDEYRQDSAGRSQNSDDLDPLTCDNGPSKKIDEQDSLSGAPASGAEAVTDERETGAPREDTAQVLAAERFAADLPGRLGKTTVRRLAPLVAAALADGYTPETLRAELAELVDVSRIENRGALPSLYARALGDLPPAPAAACPKSAGAPRRRRRATVPDEYAL